MLNITNLENNTDLIKYIYKINKFFVYQFENGKIKQLLILFNFSNTDGS